MCMEIKRRKQCVRGIVWYRQGIQEDGYILGDDAGMMQACVNSNTWWCIYTYIYGQEGRWEVWRGHRQVGEWGGGWSGARRGMEGGGFHCRCFGTGNGGGTGAGAIFQPKLDWRSLWTGPPGSLH